MTEPQPVGELETLAVRKAAAAVADVFDRLLVARDEPEFRDDIRAAFGAGAITIRAELRFDLSGMASYQYFIERDGEEYLVAGTV